MNELLCFSRRYIIATGLAAGFGHYLRVPGQTAAQAAPWTPADGLRLAGPSQGLATLDPALGRDLDTVFLLRQVCRGLMGYEEDLAPRPELAASVKVLEDQRVYTFLLREGAKFHDGRPIEAEDVRFSLSRALNPATANGDLAALPGPVYLRDIVGADAVMRGEAETLAGIDVVDQTTVRISLVAPSSTFLMKLAAMPAAILDRHQEMTAPGWWTTLNGSGPFRIATIEPDTELVLHSMGPWLGKDIAIGEIRLRLGMTAAQPVNLFQAGEIDLVPGAPPQLISLVTDPASGIAGAYVLEEPQLALSYIAFGNQRPPLDDVHIRRALQHAFPAMLFAEAGFDGRVHPATSVIPPGMLDREWPATMPEVDIEAARREIAASRYGDAAAVPVIRVHAADITAVEALRDVARESLGLTVEAIQVNWADFLSGLSARRWDAYALFWGVDYPDPEALLDVLFGSDSAENYTGYTNPDLDALLAEARAQPDAEARAEIHARAQQMLIDDAAVIPLYMPILYTIARQGMSHVPTTPMGLMGLEALS